MIHNAVLFLDLHRTETSSVKKKRNVRNEGPLAPFLAYTASILIQNERPCLRSPLDLNKQQFYRTRLYVSFVNLVGVSMRR